MQATQGRALGGTRRTAPAGSGGWRQARLRADRTGATALEFAIVSIPFLALLLFFFELGLDYYYQTALDYGLAKAARQVQIGNAQNISTPQAFMQKLLCPAVSGLLDCAAIDVASVTIAGGSGSDYYTSTLPSPTQGGTLSLSGYSAGFTTGNQNSPMYVQAVLQSPSLIAWFIPGFATPTGSGRVRLTVSSIAFMNENYANAPTQPAG